MFKFFTKHTNKLDNKGFSQVLKNLTLYNKWKVFGSGALRC